MGKIFELRKNHIGLKYLFEQLTLNARKIRWMEFLSEYDLNINHIKGKKNKFSNALSIRVNLIHATIVSMNQSDWKSIVLDDLVIDQHYLQENESLHQGDVQQKIKEYEIKEDGLIMHKNKIYVPSSGELRNVVLMEMHDNPYVGHIGYQKTIGVVRSQFFLVVNEKGCC
jgi:hypothetical protein